MQNNKSQFNTRFKNIESIRKDFLKLTYYKINDAKLKLNYEKDIDMQVVSAFDDLYYKVLAVGAAQDI